MRPDDRDAAHLWDMLEAAREAQDVIAGIDADRLLADRLRLRALERTLEIAGEAARRVSPGFQAACRDIDWRGLVGLRNVLAHEYGRVNHRLLLLTATRDLPRLIAALEKLLRSA